MFAAGDSYSGYKSPEGAPQLSCGGWFGFPQSPACRTVTEDRYNDGKA